MIDHFVVKHHTDGDTSCRIFVEPSRRYCSITVIVAGLIAVMADENEPSLRSLTHADWSDIDQWDRRAAALAKAYSPAWRGIAAS